MSYSYERYERRARQNRDGRSVLGYWVPLGLTVAAATMTIAAWIWSERHNDDDDDGQGDRVVKESQDEKRARPSQAVSGDGPSGAGRDAPTETRGPEEPSSGFMARMSGAIRRSPSPQQILDGASRRVVAGVAAAGAAVEGALSSIREEEKDAYGDHSRWSEETRGARDTRDLQAAGPSAPTDAATHSSPEVPTTGIRTSSTWPTRSGPTSSYQNPQKRKTVAIVVSGDSEGDLAGDHDYHHEDAVRLPDPRRLLN